MQNNTEEVPKMNFTDYFEKLSREDKVALRDKLVPKYMQIATFYQKLARNGWTQLELEKLNVLTGKNFTE